MFDQSIPKAERFRQSAKPVLLAGNLNFEMAEYPQLGAGRLISWSVESGHFQPTDKDAVKNRIGFIQQLLPIGACAFCARELQGHIELSHRPIKRRPAGSRARATRHGIMRRAG